MRYTAGDGLTIKVIKRAFDDGTYEEILWTEGFEEFGTKTTYRHDVLDMVDGRFNQGARFPALCKPVKIERVCVTGKHMQLVGE